jgi:hypothetical protein
MANTYSYWRCFLFLSLLIGCRKPYEPAVIKANNKFLVFSGVINTGPNAVTTIQLSRTRNLVDTLPYDPESSAKAIIETEGGPTFTLQERGRGTYVSGNLNLPVTRRYRINITTADGNRYLSDFVSAKQTPPIDSISWQQDIEGSRIYVNTHDPQNKARYYRWEYVETWEYHSFYDSYLGFKNGQLYYLDSTEYRGVCWDSAVSTEILLGSSVKLSEDVITSAPITSIARHDEKMIQRYSILVRQYALTQEAFEHWQIIEKNKNQRGTVFEGQPAQLTANIQCITNPGEPVVGFVSACSIEEKRIFIRNSEVAPWGRGPTGVACTVFFIDPADAAQHLNNPVNAPAYYVQGALAVSTKRCVDCTLNGKGRPIKPSFWP